MEEKRNEIDPFIDILIEYIKSGKGYIRNHDVLILCDVVEKSRDVIKSTHYDICALVTLHMKNVGALDRHKQGACFMVAVMDGLYIPENLDHLEIYRDTLAVWAGVCMMATLFAAEEGCKNLSKSGKIEFPAKIRERNEYEFNLEYRLGTACECNVDRGILALFLASELFFIESHNRNFRT
jgi:hypothetical protein